MKIIFDFRKYDGVVGGVEQGVIQITKRIPAKGHSVVLVCKQSRLEQTKEIFADTPEIKVVPLDVPNHSMSIANAKIDSYTLQDLAIEEKADFIHFFYNWSFPFKQKVPCLLTIHDVIPFTFREAMGLFRNLFIYKPGIRQACKLNTMIATVSEYSRQDLHKKVGVPLEKIRVVPNGLREENPKNEALENELKKRFGVDQFILNVGGIHERKNIVRMIRSFNDLIKTTGYPGKLLITGSISGAPYQNKMKKMIDAEISKMGIGDRIVFSGFVSEEELDSLFRVADLLIYPSLYEGFGIPILEAMKMGLPVITSNVTGMPEVAGDAAVLIDPTDTNNMTAAMADLLKDEQRREELRKKGIEHAKTYTWERVVDAYLKLYEEVIAKFKG